MNKEYIRLKYNRCSFLYFFILVIIFLFLNEFFLSNLIYAEPIKPIDKKNLRKKIEKNIKVKKGLKSNIRKKIKPKQKDLFKNSKPKNIINKSKLTNKAKKISSKEVFQILICDTLHDGVIYKNIKFGRGKQIHYVHILETDIENNVCIQPLKAGNTNYDLRKLNEIILSYQQNQKEKVIGAVNGSFWRAYNNFPIGITVIDGEIVELLNHKNWSNALFDDKGKLLIDRIKIIGRIKYKKSILAEVETINRRRDSIGVVIYNRFGGDTIPYIQKEKFEEALKIAIANEITDSIFEDSTEEAFDTLKFRQEMLASRRSSMIEFPLKKIALKYLNTPSINSDIHCLVMKIDTGCLAIPKNGCIISLGTDYYNKIPSIGDTLVLKFEIQKYPKYHFVHIISATPRLVRNGIAKNEAIEEGSRGRRFIYKALPRTAIGTNRGRNKIYLVAVEGTKRSQGTVGASLSQLANIMKRIGCYNAMNLDGGGSSIMIINNKNVLYNSNPEISRRISIGIGIIEK